MFNLNILNNMSDGRPPMRYRFLYQTGHKVVEFVDYLGDLTLFFQEACRTLPPPGSSGRSSPRCSNWE